VQFSGRGTPAKKASDIDIGLYLRKTNLQIMSAEVPAL
jgi:hypothetical protein